MIRFAKRRLGHLFPSIPGQSGYHKRVRGRAPQSVWLAGYLARVSPSWCDQRLRLLRRHPRPLRAVAPDGGAIGVRGHAPPMDTAPRTRRHLWGFKRSACRCRGRRAAFEWLPQTLPASRESRSSRDSRRALSPSTAVSGDKGELGRLVLEVSARASGGDRGPRSSCQDRPAHARAGAWRPGGGCASGRGEPARGCGRGGGSPPATPAGRSPGAAARRAAAGPRALRPCARSSPPSARGVFLRPDRRDEAPRFGNLGRVRQWIEANFDQLKDQLSLERHGAHTMPGLRARVAQRLLALGTCVWHNWEIGCPGRSLIAYGLLRVTTVRQVAVR